MGWIIVGITIGFVAGFGVCSALVVGGESDKCSNCPYYHNEES